MALLCPACKIRDNNTVLNDVDLVDVVSRISQERGSPLSQRVENGVILIIWPELILTVVPRSARRRHYRERITKVSLMIHQLHREVTDKKCPM